MVRVLLMSGVLVACKKQCRILLLMMLSFDTRCQGMGHWLPISGLRKQLKHTMITLLILSITYPL